MKENVFTAWYWIYTGFLSLYFFSWMLYPATQQGPVSPSLRANFALYSNLKDCGGKLDVRFGSLSLWSCQFYTVSQCFKWSGPRSYISLALFSVKEKNISSAGTILQTDQIKRMIPHSAPDKQVTPEMPVKFLLNPSIPCVQVCLLVLNRALGLLT